MLRRPPPLLKAAAVATVTTCALALPATTAQAQPDTPVFEDGMAQPVYADDAVIRTDAWVEVPGVDSDNDGENDRVHVHIARPASSSDQPMPVVMQASPYFSGGNAVTNHDVDVPLYAPDKPGYDNSGPGEESQRAELLSQLGITTTDTSDLKIGPSRYEEYFLPRGFVAVYAESLGSGASTGCPTSGGRNETLGMKAVVDWLNGRTTATGADGDPAVADWSTGQTGMIGVSYNGTLPNAVASTGVDGLEAIVPISAISSWYDYYRANGLVVAPGGYQGEDTDVLADYVLTRDDPQVCAPVIQNLVETQDRVTGDYSSFWAERDYMRDVENVEAAVLAQHGLNDWNVKTLQTAQWYDAVAEQGVPHKVWWHQRGHGDWAYRLNQDAWLREVNRWFTRFMYDVPNGVESEPHAVVQREDGSWHTEADWPAPAAEAVDVTLLPGGRTTGGLTAGHRDGRAVTETIVDDASFDATGLASADASPHRLVYSTETFEEAVRVSGTVELDLRLSFSDPAANVSAALVDYAPDGSAFVVTEGWMDPQNRKSPSRTFAIKPGTPYDIEFGMQPDDYEFQPGHRLAVVLFSSDHDFTLRPEPGTELDVDLRRSTVTLPVVGGGKAWP